MIEVLPRNIIRFIVLIFLQIFIFNSIQLSGYINPYIYILFIILLPFNTPRWALLITSFLLGFFIDIFSHTPGMHSTASTLIGFSRPFILGLYSPRDGYTASTEPRISDYGFNWFAKYATTMVLIHHTVLFFIDAFGFSHFFGTVFRIILSSIFSIGIILLSQLLLDRK